MYESQFDKYKNIPKEKFELSEDRQFEHDAKLETKPIGYLRDAFNRFAKNKASVVAAIIIGILLIFSLLAPYLCHQNYVDAYKTDIFIKNYRFLLPKLSFLEGTGIWDVTKVIEVAQTRMDILSSMGIERGEDVVVDVLETKIDSEGLPKYKIRLNTYTSIDVMTMTLTEKEYKEMQAWQNETGIQLILPRVNNQASSINPNIWYKSDMKGKALRNSAGELVPAYYTTGEDDYTSTKRLAADPGNWKYAQRTGTAEKGYNYVVRLDPYTFFIYRFGFEPAFTFGTDGSGYDIFQRLGAGARFSILFAISVSVINLTIGAFYGAVEGYYGGATDMIMERISDILYGIPFTVVTVLFSLHLSSKIGVVPSILLAFVMTGWIGMASRVRMQFYRFKNSEYVLAARTLGASDKRIMFKHIFPNSLGTIITGSVLVIPGVIFSETSLSYLGIINLDSTTLSSVGTMLSNGQAALTQAPHVVFFPALFIALLEISFNLFGNGLRDAFNPSLRGTEE